MTNDEVTAVQYEIDAAFVATHDLAEVLDPVWWSGNIYAGLAEYERCLAPFSELQRLLYALLCLRRGGSDRWASFVRVEFDGYRVRRRRPRDARLELRRRVGDLQEAQRRMGGSVAADRAERQAHLERVEPDFGDLDTRLYALDLRGAMNAFMRGNAEAFVFSGTVLVPKGLVEARQQPLPDELRRLLAP